MGKSREHHFVPRSWQNRFSPDDTVMVWAYDHERTTLSLRSTKTTMQEYDLYTVDPGGTVDTTLEEVDLQAIDNSGAQILRAVVEGDRSEAAKLELARFLAVGMVRTPAMVARYKELMSELVLQLIEASHATSYETFVAHVRAHGHPGMDFSRDDYSALKDIPAPALEAWVIDRLNRLANPHGDSDLPHTDAIRAPSGRALIEEALLSLEWTVAKAPDGGLILGDMGPVYDYADLWSGFRAPLSPTCALIGAPSTDPRANIQSIKWGTHDVAALNAESAARARRWLIASSEADLEPFINQLDRNLV